MRRRALSSVMMMLMLVMVCAPAVSAFSLWESTGSNFLDAIVNITDPMTGGPVEVGNTTVSSFQEGVAEWYIQSGQAKDFVNKENVIRERQIDTLAGLASDLIQLMIHTGTLMLDIIVLGLLMAEMMLVLTVFTRLIPMLFRKMVDNISDFIARRLV